MALVDLADLAGGMEAVANQEASGVMAGGLVARWEVAEVVRVVAAVTAGEREGVAWAVVARVAEVGVATAAMAAAAEVVVVRVAEA